MQIDVKELLVNQSTWQKSRKSASWGDKIREVERVRESLGGFSYKETTMRNRLQAVREGEPLGSKAARGGTWDVER